MTYVSGINFAKRRGTVYEARMQSDGYLLTRFDMETGGVIPGRDIELTFDVPIIECQQYLQEKEHYLYALDEKLAADMMRPAPEPFRPGVEPVETESFEGTLGLILSEVNDTLRKKNKDYGSSYDKSVEKYGKSVTLIRLSDKFNRLENLILSNSLGEVEETEEETLLDLVGYGILELVRRRRL